MIHIPIGVTRYTTRDSYKDTLSDYDRDDQVVVRFKIYVNLF